jgi:hypothetical protein
MLSLLHHEYIFSSLDKREKMMNEYIQTQKYNMKNFKLCYIEGDTAYFTTQDLDKQWGDDWDDAPYEHNAETPYEPGVHYYSIGVTKKNEKDWNEDGTPKWEIYKLKFESYNLETPGSACGNSRYSVKDINAGAVAWLYGPDKDKKAIAINAGASIEEFKMKVRASGGKIYIEEQEQCAMVYNGYLILPIEARAADNFDTPIKKDTAMTNELQHIKEQLAVLTAAVNRLLDTPAPPPTATTFDFGDGPVLAHRHVNPDGSLGGWVADTATVEPTAYVGPDARVYGTARVFENAWVGGDAFVSENAWVFGDAWVGGNARVYGNALVFENALVHGKAQVFANAQVRGTAWVFGNARVFENIDS